MRKDRERKKTKRRKTNRPVAPKSKPAPEPDINEQAEEQAEEQDENEEGEDTGEQETSGHFHSPESSTISSADYNGGRLTVYFKRGPDRANDRYDYDGVPAELWAEFAASDSKGKFFGTRIRPHYTGRQYGAGA